jgi:hypothetical protein
LLLSTQTVDPSPVAPVRVAERTSDWADRFVAGSMRVASPLRKCATQTASVVAVISAGRAKTVMVATTWFVPGSTRATRPCWSLETQTEPWPTAALS